MSLPEEDLMMGKPIEIAIGIVIEIESNDHMNRLDPDPDSDFDPEYTFDSIQALS
jgi:hypothetical protein